MILPFPVRAADDESLPFDFTPVDSMMRKTAAETSGPMPSPGINVTRCVINGASITGNAFVKLSSNTKCRSAASAVHFRGHDVEHSLDTMYTVRYKTARVVVDEENIRTEERKHMNKAN